MRSLASSSRNWSPVKAVAPLVALLDLIDATSRIGLAPNTFAMTASASAPCRMVLACLAMFAPCAERIDRSAASRRAGDASPTRWPMPCMTTGRPDRRWGNASKSLPRRWRNGPARRKPPVHEDRSVFRYRLILQP